MLACNWRLQRLFAFELRWRSRRSGRVCLGFIKFCARALNWAERMKQTSQAEQPNVPPAARLPPKSTTPQRRRNLSPSRTCAESDRPKTPNSGQLGSRVGKFELGARLDGDDQGGPTRHRTRRAANAAHVLLLSGEESLRRQWLRGQSRFRPDVVARARIIVHT